LAHTPPVRFKQVDVFTRTPLRGNPVAVVLDGDGLTGAEMQRIAGWTNLSETTFVLPPTSAAADYRLRIFTPRAELPFAGHPTIGSAHAVLEAGIVKPKNGRLRQECGAGVLELNAEPDGRLWVRSPASSAAPLDAALVPALEHALGAKPGSQPIVVSVGPVWIVADLGSAEIVGKLLPDMERIARLADAAKATGVTVFGASSDGRSAIHVRSFAPAHGVPEDPVCGSGNISVAAYVSRTGLTKRYGAQYVSRQGMQLGRDGEVSIRIGDAGRAIDLGGYAVTCVEGTLRVE
jgi:PhzF family phenazine biosynthesis protein